MKQKLSVFNPKPDIKKINFVSINNIDINKFINSENYQFKQNIPTIIKNINNNDNLIYKICINNFGIGQFINELLNEFNKLIINNQNIFTIHLVIIIPEIFTITDIKQIQNHVNTDYKNLYQELINHLYNNQFTTATLIEICTNHQNIIVDCYFDNLQQLIIDYKQLHNYFDCIIDLSKVTNTNNNTEDFRINTANSNKIINNHNNILLNNKQQHNSSYNPCFIHKSLNNSDIKRILKSQEPIAIIGSGIAGITAASELINLGFKVDLYEANDIAHGASGNIAGLMYPQLFDDDEQLIYFYQQAYLQAMIFYKNNDNYNCFKPKIIKLFANNFKFHQKISKCLPIHNLQNNKYIEIQGAILKPKEFIIQQIKKLQKSGLKLFIKHKVLDINPIYNDTQNIVSHELTINNNTLICKKYPWVIIANGYQSGCFSYTKDINAYPVRGQLSIINADNHQINEPCCYNGSYLIPLSSQQILIGATHQRSNMNKNIITADDIYNLNIWKSSPYKNIFNSLSLTNNVTESRCSIRYAMRDRYPIASNINTYKSLLTPYKNLYEDLRKRREIQVSPAIDRVSIISALASRGLTTAPILAKHICRSMFNIASPINNYQQQQLHMDRQYLRRFMKGNYLKINKQDYN